MSGSGGATDSETALATSNSKTDRICNCGRTSPHGSEVVRSSRANGVSIARPAPNRCFPSPGARQTGKQNPLARVIAKNPIRPPAIKFKW